VQFEPVKTSQNLLFSQPAYFVGRNMHGQQAFEFVRKQEMNDKMLAVETTLADAVKALEDLALEAHDNQSKSRDAIEVLARMAEALLEATHNAAGHMAAELVVTDSDNRPS
jgi:hypothetical protein